MTFAVCMLTGCADGVDDAAVLAAASQAATDRAAIEVLASQAAADRAEVAAQLLAANKEAAAKTARDKAAAAAKAKAAAAARAKAAAAAKAKAAARAKAAAAAKAKAAAEARAKAAAEARAEAEGNGISLEVVERRATELWIETFGGSVTSVSCSSGGHQPIEDLPVGGTFGCQVDSPVEQYVYAAGTVTGRRPFFSMYLYGD